MEDTVTGSAALAQTQTAILVDIQELAKSAPGWMQAEKQRHGPKRQEPVAGPGLQRKLARMQAAHAALALVYALITDDAGADRLFDKLAATRAQLAAVAHPPSDWLESRMVKRTYTRQNGSSVTYTFGPYIYYRWLEGLRERTCYLGKLYDDGPKKPATIQDHIWKLSAMGVDVRTLSPSDLVAEIVAKCYGGK